MSCSFVVHQAVLRLVAVSAPNRKSHLVLTYRASEDANLCFVRRRRPVAASSIASQRHTGKSAIRLSRAPATARFSRYPSRQPHFAARTAIVPAFISAMIGGPHDHNAKAAQNNPDPHGGARLAQSPWPPAEVERRFVFQCGSFDHCEFCSGLSRATKRGPSQSSMSLSLTSCCACRRPSWSFSQTMTTVGAAATLRLLLMG